MRLSILIVNWNTKELVKKAVASILQDPPKFDFEVVIVDNASTDGSQEMLSSAYSSQPRVVAINSKQNLGFGRASNFAYENCSGEYIFLLNPDTEVKPEALEKLVGFLSENADVGVVGPKLLNPDGSTQQSVRKFPRLGSSLLVFSGLHRIIKPKQYLMSGFDYTKQQEVDQVMGAALMTRRDIVTELGLFDENFYLWYEEVDFCKRVKDAGHKVIYLPQAEIMHHTAQSFSQLRVWKRKKTVAESLIYYFKKHGTAFDVWVLRLAMIAILSVAWFTGLFNFKSKIKVS